MNLTRTATHAAGFPAIVLLALALAACNQNPVEQLPQAAAPQEAPPVADEKPQQATVNGSPEPGMSPGKPQAPVEASVVSAPALQVGVPATLILEVRASVAAEGIEITIEGDAGLTVVDYAPKLLPATEAAAGHQVRVELVPASGGTGRLTARLVLLMGAERQTRLVTLPFAVSGPVTILPGAEKPSEPPVRDAAGELVRPMPAETTVRDR